jgi:phosphoserine aminotransferase
VISLDTNQGSSMPADSDSTIAWHRAQLKKLRQTLKDIETSRFTVGESSHASRSGKTKRIVADLQRKISHSLKIIATYERQTRRPLATDQQSLASVSWSSWNARRAHTRSKTSS